MNVDDQDDEDGEDEEDVFDDDDDDEDDQNGQGSGHARGHPNNGSSSHHPQLHGSTRQHQQVDDLLLDELDPLSSLQNRTARLRRHLDILEEVLTSHFFVRSSLRNFFEINPITEHRPKK